jgi:SAM-dependent methyltransferase
MFRRLSLTFYGVMIMSEEYYTGERGRAYFNHRKSKSTKAQEESAKVFSGYIAPDAVVLDFGCGTGGIVSNIRCARRIGIEINEQARELAAAKGVEVFHDLSEVPARSVDVVITHHAIEHTRNPMEVLVGLSGKLKPKGRIIVVVPAEQPRSKRNRHWRSNIDRHLFCWSPLTLGNLLECAGYEVDDAFILPGGYSHYIEWARPLPWLFETLKLLVAYTLGRFNTVCTGHIK